MKLLLTIVLLINSTLACQSAAPVPRMRMPTTDFIQLPANRTIIVRGMIYSQMAGLANQVLKWAKVTDGEKEPIGIYIDSPGGSVVHGNMLISAMKAAHLRGYEFHCAVGPMAASMAFITLSYCDKRYSLSMSLFLWHPIRIQSMESLTPAVTDQILKQLKDLSREYDKQQQKALGASDEYFRKHYNAETLHVASVLAEEVRGFVTIVQDIRGIADLYQ